jgi:hypothetical protein
MPISDYASAFFFARRDRVTPSASRHRSASKARVGSIIDTGSGAVAIGGLPGWGMVAASKNTAGQEFRML